MCELGDTTHLLWALCLHSYIRVRLGGHPGPSSSKVWGGERWDARSVLTAPASLSALPAPRHPCWALGTVFFLEYLACTKLCSGPGPDVFLGRTGNRQASKQEEILRRRADPSGVGLFRGGPMEFLVERKASLWSGPRRASWRRWHLGQALSLVLQAPVRSTDCQLGGRCWRERVLWG